MRTQKAIPFTMTDYKLIPGTLLYRKTIRNADYMLEMNLDTLLYTFRVNAGLDTKGAPLPVGWESPHLHFRGQFIGHYLTACARASLTLEKLDPRRAELLRGRAEEIVRELRRCQEALALKEAHPGYLGAIETSMFDDLEQLHFTGVFTVIYYNQHKIMCGLLDAYTLLGNRLALEMLEGMADYIGWRLSRLTEERIQQMIETRWYREDNTTFHMEFGGMAELLLRLYRETGKEEHLALARKFDRRWFRNMLLGKKDMLGHYSLHANTEIPCVAGLAEFQDVTGDDEAGECVDRFMGWLREGHMLPTGGVSGRSAYTDPADYGGELFEFPHMYWKHTNFKCGESCCSHNLNVLARREFQWTADSTWAAEHEKRYVNAVLAQQHPVTGGFVYNLKVGQGSRKAHSTDGFFCCNGTGVESHAYLTEGAFFHKGDTLWITNYVPCDLDWKEQGVRIEARTDFPADGKGSWTIRMEQERTLKILLRIPEWTDGGVRVSVNGQEMEKHALQADGSFLCLERIWKDGDRVEADFPFAVRTERMEDRPEYVAVHYGPHLLAACTEGYAQFDGTAEELAASLKPVGKPCHFETVLSTGKTVFMPICDVEDEEYNGYTIVTKGVPFRVVDALLIGSEASERDHDLVCAERERTDGETENWLACRYPGGFSCSFQTVPGKKLWLRCYYRDHGVFYRHPEEPVSFNQCFRFEIEDGRGTEEIAVQTLNENGEEPLTAVYYPVMERDGRIRLNVSGSRYEGVCRGTGRFYDRIELGYFEDGRGIIEF